jgi:malonyl-CoA/methylmalonyl-CoA synthetase
MIRRLLRALEEGQRRALISGLDAGGEVSWTRTGEDLLERAGAWQGLLRSRGVRPGDRIALEFPRGPDLLPGTAVVPLNPALSRSERARVLERADVRTVLTGADPVEGGGTLSLREAPPGTPALLVFTSGTTGEPKGVPLDMRNLEANLSALENAWGLDPSDRLLHVLPTHHVHGLVLALYGSARLGIPVLLDQRFDADRTLLALESHGATVFMGVPTMYHRMTGSPVKSDARRVRVFISGSAPLSPHDFRRFEERFGHRPLERYGLTETMIVASNPLDGERRPGTVGLALRDTELRLADDGEIEVRSPAMMAGYWRAPEPRSEFSVDGFFRTGDLGRYDEHGYLAIAGRKKELILVGGSNVLPGEVERALAGQSGIEELAVVGLPDDDLGEVVGAFVVATPGEEERGLESRLRERAEGTLAPYKRPRIYRFVASLPRNAMGKIDRRALVTGTRPR